MSASPSSPRQASDTAADTIVEEHHQQDQPSSPASTPTPTPIAKLRQVVNTTKLNIQKADSSTRKWLHANSKLISTSGNLLHSFAFVTPSSYSEGDQQDNSNLTRVAIRAELAATIFSLLRIYQAYPSTSTRCLLINFIKSIQLLIEMVIVSKKPQNQLDIISIIETFKVMLRLSSFWSTGKLLTGEDESLNEDQSDENDLTCTCGLNVHQQNEFVHINKGPRMDSSILRIRQNKIQMRKKLRLNKKRQRSNAQQAENESEQQQISNQNQRPFSTLRIAGLEPPPSILRRITSTTSSILSLNQNEQYLDEGGEEQQVDEDPLLEALFVIAYERRSNWLIRLFMPDLQCAACSLTIKLPTPKLSNTLQNINNSLTELKPIHILAEVFHITRPLFHIMLIRKYGWRSWKPWFSSLLLDLSSRMLLFNDENINNENNHEWKVERRKRMANLVLYLGRTPIFDLILRNFIKKFTYPLTKLPIVGNLTSSAITWITLLQQYWFYTSAS